MSRGFSLLEICVTLVIGAVLTAAAALLIARQGSRSVVRNEADTVAGYLADLRSKATTGMGNPCLDFPDERTVRVYRDTSRVPDGFGPGDPVLKTHAFAGGVHARDIDGGSGASHFVCFEARGIMGSTGRALEVTLVAPAGGIPSVVRLLPSTGMARVL